MISSKIILLHGLVVRMSRIIPAGNKEKKAYREIVFLIISTEIIFSNDFIK